MHLLKPLFYDNKIGEREGERCVNFKKERQNEQRAISSQEKYTV